MKKKLIKESIVSIRKTIKRFISILLIVLLGVGFYAGIKATSPDMKATIDEYYKENNFMDFNLKSTWGISNDDIDSFIDNGYDIEGSYDIDAVVTGDNELVAHILSYNEDSTINKLTLVNGSYPKNDNECLVEENQYTEALQIGSKIIVQTDDLIENELTVVGTIKSPVYISLERGSTKLLSGKINYYMYVRESNFNLPYYTEANIKLDTDLFTFGNDYTDLIEEETKKLENITSVLSDDRYNEEIESLKAEYGPYFDEDSISLEKPKWYILDRESNIGYYQYSEDADRITNIAKLFPLVFYVVAILICLTTMTRMVEEERTQLGILKSLGYSDGSIISKYLIYALIATILGSFIGVCIGFVIIPKVIYNMYSMMYDIGALKIEFNVHYAFMGTVIAVICTLLATLYACYKELKEVPAELMRPKSPKVGKKVLLERITFIWKRLSFSNKVTVRNVFRYKKRFLMTIIGITGCTGLILAGFGLRDCIVGMVPNQYGKVFDYEMEVTLNNDLTNEELTDCTDKISEIEEVKSYIRLYKESISITNYDTNQSIQLVVPIDKLDNYINLKVRKTGEDISLNDGIVVSEKLTKLLDLDINDTLEMEGSHNYKENITGITENYLNHYIYMSKDSYNQDNYNTLLIKLDEMTEKEEVTLSKKLQEIEGVSAITFTSTTKHVFDTTMENFGYVAFVLIVSAGLLAFVVLYNLANINISERKRELATIKVLGFYDKEVYNYIGRETVILSVIGVLLGLGFGNILTTFIIKTCELDMIMFNPVISISSYFFAVIITFLFNFVVNILVYFALKKIDMIESLKSVE